MATVSDATPVSYGTLPSTSGSAPSAGSQGIFTATCSRWVSITCSGDGRVVGYGGSLILITRPSHDRYSLRRGGVPITVVALKKVVIIITSTMLVSVVNVLMEASSRGAIIGGEQGG